MKAKEKKPAKLSYEMYNEMSELIFNLIIVISLLLQ